MRALLLLLVACGDATPIVPTLEATSGSRIKLEQYLYEDGTRQLDARTFYDTRLHARCAAGIWGDGEQRCIPLASDAVFVDSECTRPIGIVRATPEIDPSVFIGYDYVEGVPIPMRLYRAGVVTEHEPEHYRHVDGVCSGPYPSPPEAVFLTITAELPASTLALVYDIKAGEGRLELRAHATDDGLFAPVAIHDRALDFTCTPAMREDGVACEAAQEGFSFVFADAACTEPAITVESFAEVPVVARTGDVTTCATSYHPLAESLDEIFLVESSTGGCAKRFVGGGTRAFRLGAAVDIARLDHEVEAAPEQRRLSRVTLADPTDTDVRYTSTLLVDRATRTECRRAVLGELERCIPAHTIDLRLAYDSTCTIEMRVAEVAATGCATASFATGLTDDRLGITLHAVGDPVTETVYRLVGPGCAPYVTPSDVKLHHVGPALPPETFPAAFRFGER